MEDHRAFFVAGLSAPEDPLRLARTMPEERLVFTRSRPAPLSAPVAVLTSLCDSGTARSP